MSEMKISQQPYITLIFISAVLFFFATAFLFVIRNIEDARSKEFWIDEHYGLYGSARPNTYEGLLISGAQGQGSPAPLDYLLVKFLDEIRTPWGLNWIPANIYYRLNSIWWNLVFGLFVALLFLRIIRSQATDQFVFLLQAICLGLALSFYYFHPHNMYFSIEMRPFALWNSLWFCLMALCLLYFRFHWSLIIIGVFLAMTSVGALFQLVILALCRLFFRIFNYENKTAALIDTLKEFALPLGVALYYAARSPHFGYLEAPQEYQRYLKEFFIFWTHKEMVPIISISGIILTVLQKKWASHALIFVTMLLLYLLSPLCNHQILSKGLFFSSRQYLYYDLIYAVFLLSFSIQLPNLYEKIRNFRWN